MAALSAAARGGEVARRKDEDSKACLQISSHHMRSRSSSDKNAGSAWHGISHSIGEDPFASKDLQSFMRFQGTHSPFYQYTSDTGYDASSSHRGSQVETDNEVEQLQMRLHQERSMRVMLERAMGRASSTLSPGHRHFSEIAETKEIIQEIELLEKEVANREQHVLSLYRSIFDQCLSTAPSEQSSVMTSPAHTKNEVKKHPSIISSTFCSSKKFPLHSLQVLTSRRDSGKKNMLQSKTRHASLFGGKTNIHNSGNFSDTMKVLGRPPTYVKNSLARSLKDHLNQSPVKISEDLVTCMAAIYCWICSAAPTKSARGHSPPLPRSSTKVVLPRRSVGDERNCSGRSMVEISSISTDEDQNSRAITTYSALVKQLEGVNPTQMDTDAKMAFWINVYNSLVMHAYLVYGIPHNSLKRRNLFHKVTYNIGGYNISANSIEYSILCIRAPRIGRWFEIILSNAMRRKSGEDKLLLGSGFSLAKSEPLICFGLCTGASSDPSLKAYTATNIKDELEMAKKDYLQANVVVKKSNRVLLPKIVERYAKEASVSSENLLSWVCENIDKKLHGSIQKCIESTSGRKASNITEWLPYDIRFRYVFTKELTEKALDMNFFCGL